MTVSVSFCHTRHCESRTNFREVANIPAELTHLLEEIQAKDLQIAAFKDEITKRDNALQKWVRVNGGHVHNPKEDAFSRTINDCYDKCEILQAEKCGLSQKIEIVLNKQIKRLDVGLRGLAAREEFPSDWGGPSLLSGTATGVHTPAAGAGATVHSGGPLQAVSGNIGSTGGMPNIANAAQMRMAQQNASSGRGATSGTQTPTNMPRAQREGSSEASKRRRLNASLGTLPNASSSLRQSSLGPGTPKAGTPGPAATGGSRAGSAQPSRPVAGQKKAAPAPVPTRKPAPPASSRRRDRDRKSRKGDRRRQLKSDRATPSTNASLSSDDEESATSPNSSSIVRSQADGAGDRKTNRASRREASDDEDDEEAEEDNTLYCTCQRPSFGEMIGCDNDNCEFQWFHYECVGIKQQPAGEWLCPSCRRLPKGKIVKDSE
jgi:inhibitor of growth protein 3